MLLKNLSSLLTRQHHLPLNLKLTISFPKIKTQNSDSPTVAAATTDCSHHRSPPLHLLVFLSLLCNSFSTCYYFQLKIKIHTQCLGVLAFLFLFSLILSFSIETKQRKGRLLNDENRGNISLFFFLFFFFQNLEI